MWFVKAALVWFTTLVTHSGSVCFSQELMSRTSLETQKLDLMDEVSYLKLKLVGMEETNDNTHAKDPAATEQNKAEVWRVTQNK